MTSYCAYLLPKYLVTMSIDGEMGTFATVAAKTASSHQDFFNREPNCSEHVANISAHSTYLEEGCFVSSSTCIYFMTHWRSLHTHTSTTATIAPRFSRVMHLKEDGHNVMTILVKRTIITRLQDDGGKERPVML